MILRENKRRKKAFDFDLIFLMAITLFLAISLGREVFGKEVCPIRLDEKMVAKIPITLRGTVLSFPVKPTKVILGKNGSFGIEYVENDLAISPLSSNARSNLFVYLQGRRFTFDLFIEASGCTVVQVRDALEVQTRVDFGGKIKMVTEPEVKIVSDNGILNQFGRGPFYRKKPDFSSKKAAMISLGVLVLASLPIFLSNPPDADKEVKSDLLFSGDINQGNSVGFPEHQTNADGATKNKKMSGSNQKGKAEKFKGPQLLTRPRNFKVLPGTFVKGVLLTGASNGPVRAQLQEAVSLNGETLIDNGAILMGTGQSTDERLLIRFSKVILKDGTVETIGAQAADFDDKIAGLTGSKVGHYALKLGAAVGLNFVTGMSEGLQESEVQNGVAVKKADAKNALYNGMATAAAEQAQELMSTAKNKQPVIEVQSGTPIYIIFSSEEN